MHLTDPDSEPKTESCSTLNLIDTNINVSNNLCNNVENRVCNNLYKPSARTSTKNSEKHPLSDFPF